jgi:hypothetical protein
METKPVGIMNKHIISDEVKVMINETPHNTGLAKVAVRCSADTFAVNQSLVLRINPESNRDGENRHLCQARKC